MVYFCYKLKASAESEIKSLYKKRENGADSFCFKKKILCTSLIYSLSLFKTELERGPFFFFSSGPSGWFQAEQGNFTGSLINIQPLFRACLGHLAVNVNSLVQDVSEISLTLRLMT